MADREPLSVLVVDDNTDAADSLAQFLALKGYTVRTAYNGPDALTLAAATPPDVALLDLMMPVMDGWEVAKRLDAARPRPVLVAITGSDGDVSRNRSQWAHIPFHLVKPVAHEILLNLLAWADRTREARRRMDGSD
ncbi:response regulator [Limnoglobus roseus]|uniref:Response regulator n=1 Tax=Limnoglobus roseus TaxID=2598579 RepID=A0A5C1ANP9_9BACT|nr:response regulator [Limnoglobus roseus]QEL20620.1 response regulator [Limnoglobus roseus]